MITRIAWPVSSEAPQATVTDAKGEKITGSLVKLDDFDVSLREGNGTYRSWPRDEVTVNVPDQLAGHRALLPKYTDADLHNLTAYLMTLK